MNILGTRPEDIDRAEDRDKFSAMLDSIGVDQVREAKRGRLRRRFAIGVESIQIPGIVYIPGSIQHFATKSFLTDGGLFDGRFLPNMVCVFSIFFVT